MATCLKSLVEIQGQSSARSIATYACVAPSTQGIPRGSHEHRETGVMTHRRERDAETRSFPVIGPLAPENSTSLAEQSAKSANAFQSAPEVAEILHSLPHEPRETRENLKSLGPAFLRQLMWQTRSTADLPSAQATTPQY